MKDRGIQKLHLKWQGKVSSHNRSSLRPFLLSCSTTHFVRTACDLWCCMQNQQRTILIHQVFPRAYFCGTDSPKEPSTFVLLIL